MTPPPSGEEPVQGRRAVCREGGEKKERRGTAPPRRRTLPACAASRSASLAVAPSAYIRRLIWCQLRRVRANINASARISIAPTSPPPLLPPFTHPIRRTHRPVPALRPVTNPHLQISILNRHVRHFRLLQLPPGEGVSILSNRRLLHREMGRDTCGRCGRYWRTRLPRVCGHRRRQIEGGTATEGRGVLVFWGDRVLGLSR